MTRNGESMQQDIVSLDLETTGLNVEEDAIIEIGAVRIRNGEVVEEFSTFVNPSFAVPETVTYITGITQEDLRGAPSIKEALPLISDFIGQAVVVAHNVAFDIGFLRRFGALKANTTLDTIEIASILLPNVPRYNLGSLVAHLDIQLEHAHRALDDARATALLYLKLWDIACRLPKPLLNELSEFGSVLEWDLTPFFSAAAQASQVQHAPTYRFKARGSTVFEAPLEGDAKAKPLALGLIEGYLGEKGHLSNALPQFEHRQEQITLSESILQAFNTSRHLIAEAGTGTGKTLAYLVPSALWATENQQRVVVATHTINLQDQLIGKDLPIVQRAVDTPFSATVMKGRGNYVCPRRLDAVRRRHPSNLDELRTLAKVLVWLQESESGDKSELSLRGNEHSIWGRLSAEDEGCTTYHCQKLMGGVCPFHQARQRAEQAHIVIINHALLISDALAENRVLPEYDYLVIDEAHQLEEAITNGLTVRADYTSLSRRISELGGLTSGVLGDLLESTRPHVSEKQRIRLETFIQDIGDAVRDMGATARAFFFAVYKFIESLDVQGSSSTRITNQERKNKAFGVVKDKFALLGEYLLVVGKALQELLDFLKRLESMAIDDFDDHLNSVLSSANYFVQMNDLLQEFTSAPLNDRIYWVDTYSNPDYTAIQGAPIHIGAVVETHLWSGKQAVVMTSATLRVGNSFRFLQERINAQGVETLAVGSPFDYKASTLLFLPDDLPEPNKPGYQAAVERGIIELASALEGRVMVLFTSYSQLRETAANIAPRLTLGGITVYDQVTGASREALLDGFKSTHRAVLLGTRSFWQGIDIAGDDLQAVVIVRLPFAVPNDPIFAARSETYDNAFDQYAVPDAILRFRQGFGRLIRTKTDKGIVAVFDSRIISRSYGKHFIASLPECTIFKGSLSQLPARAKSWVKQD
jgi:DNA polymerase-3 subunit epsilon/ATP-dependent DNA helicase DinG